MSSENEVFDKAIVVCTKHYLTANNGENRIVVTRDRGSNLVTEIVVGGDCFDCQTFSKFLGALEAVADFLKRS